MSEDAGIAVVCDGCRYKFRVKSKAAGRTLACPKCKHSVYIPDGSEQTTFDNLPSFEPPAKPSQLMQPSFQAPHIQTQPPAHQAVQVNVSSNSGAHSLGIASMVVGVLSFFICWIPFIGFGLSGLGFVLGAIGCIVAVTRKGSGIGYSIAGTALSSFGLALGMVYMLLLQGVCSGLDEMESQMHQQQADAFGESTETQQVFLDARKPAVLGNVQVEVIGATAGLVPLDRRITGGSTSSEESLLSISLRITNLSDSKKLSYSTWRDTTSFLSTDVCSLRDNFDNTYRRVGFPFSASIRGSTDSDSIYPGESIEDVLVFELPVDSASELFLTLPGQKVGERGEFRLLLDPSLISRT